jgi:inward rectifier potassium channel
MRQLQQNRTLRVRRKGVDESPFEDLYHRLLRMSWARFFLLMLAAYILITGTFAVLYSLFPGAIANADNQGFMTYLAFSVQTMSTVGYGYLYPVTSVAHALVIFETGAGLFFTAVLTGLVFSKFSTPIVRIVFSNNIIWTTQNGKPVLSLRVGNFRANRVFNGQASMVLLRDEVSTEGEKLRRQIDLKLQRSATMLFSMSWTLFHHIDEQSPFWGMTPEQVADLKWDVYVSFVGFDEDLDKTIVAHTTYPGNMILRARKFVDMIESVDGVREVDFSKLSLIESV